MSSEDYIGDRALAEQGQPGYKLDAGKPRYDLMPYEVVHSITDILTFGAEKYPDRNWENGMRWGRVFASLMRHLWAWWNPLEPDTDAESGRSHLWHAGCCIAFLITYEARGIGEDDRPKIQE